MSHWSAALARLDACSGAVNWARTQSSYAAVWATCPRGDWMLWLLGRTDRSAPWSKERRPLVACAAACAAGVLEFMPAGEGRDATEMCLSVTQAWCEGAATRRDVGEARACADVAATYARAESANAIDAARACACAACAAVAAADVAAAYARAESADVCAACAAAACGAAGDAWPARARSLAASADIVRSHYPVGPVLSSDRALS